MLSFNNLNTLQNPTVILNVRGYRYEILMNRLSQFPATSRLGLLKDFHQLEPEQLLEICDNYSLIRKEFYFDRDPGILANILNYSSSMKLHFGQQYCSVHLRNELKYWGFDDEHLDFCCQYKLAKIDNDMKIFYKTYEEFDDQSTLALAYKDKCLGKLRMNLWNITEKPGSSWKANVNSFTSYQFVSEMNIYNFFKNFKAFFFFTNTILVISIINLVLPTIPSFTLTESINGTNVTVARDSGGIIDNSVNIAFSIIEFICVGWFTIEVIVRFLISYSNRQFFTSTYNLIDIFVLLPFYLWLCLAFLDIKILKEISRMVKILRLFKCTRYSGSLN